MCFLCPRSQPVAPASFCAQQFSASTRSAGLLLAVLFLLAAIAILFAPTVEGQTAHCVGVQATFPATGFNAAL